MVRKEVVSFGSVLSGFIVSVDFVVEINEVVVLLGFSGFNVGFVTGLVVVLFGFTGLLGFSD